MAKKKDLSRQSLLPISGYYSQAPHPDLRTVQPNIRITPQVLLLFEDDSLRESIRSILEKGGFKCEFCSEFEDAQKKIYEKDYNCFLVDMECLNDYAVRLIRSLSELHPMTGIVVLSTESEIRNAMDLLMMGIDQYLLKPVDEELLVHVIDQVVEYHMDMMDLDNYRTHMEEKVKQQTEVVRKSFLNVVSSLAEALEAKDPYTRGHSQRVAHYAQKIVKSMGGSDTLQEDLYQAGLVHDLGKIGIQEGVLLKPSKLDDDEYNHVKTHPELGVKIMKPVIQDNILLEAVRYHHERVDGRGYPDGLKGSAIPFAAQIIAVADAYDAMTSDRPYRSGMPLSEARDELRKVVGTQLAERPVHAFLEVLEEEEEELMILRDTAD